MGTRSIHWFRKGLRIHDNPALLAACDGATEVKPIFILDPWFPKNGNVGPNRWRFLLESLQDLDNQLKSLNSRLYVLHGKPNDVFPNLFKEWKITKLTYEVDTEPYSMERDEQIDKLAKEHNVEVIKCVSHTLYDTNKIVAKNGGKPPLSYQKLQSLVSSIGHPPKPVCTPKNCVTKILKDHDEKYGVPTLENIGVNLKDLGPLLFPGGESHALERMEIMLKRKNWICTFEKPQTAPNSIEPSTTVLSPYIKFGCLSARLFYNKLNEIYLENKKHSQPPVSLHGQLLWREFFYTVGSHTPNFDQMIENPICIQIPWEKNDAYLKAWKDGKTGYPFIDAIMTQLRKEGWIHHLARHAVACFLTRGDLYVSWEEGKKVFEEYLIDADWSLNAGNWMWLSASSFFYQYFRVYSPIAFGKKTDKEGNYIRKYVPVLAKYPTQYIYEPWKAPQKVQEKAGCIIGKDYPKPIVDHDIVRQKNIKKMAEAYKNRKDASESKTVTNKKRKAEIEEDDVKPKQKKSKVGSSKKITEFCKKQ